MTNAEDPSIIYQNEYNTLFIIDIPASIAQAQLNATISEPRQGTLDPEGISVSRKYLLSAAPLESPYPPSCEPKTEAARARLLKRVSPGERRFHDEIQPLLHSALRDIRDGYPSGRWCLPRHVPDEERTRTRKRRPESDHSALRKRSNGLKVSPPKIALNDRALASARPPVILSSTSANAFDSISELDGIVKNPSSQSAILKIDSCDNEIDSASEYIIPSGSHFVHCTIPVSETQDSPLGKSPIPGLPPDQQFHLIIFDPPWPNRSVRRSGHYHTHPYDILTQRLRDILHVHAHHRPSQGTVSIDRLHPTTDPKSLAGIWITNSEKSRQTAYSALTSTGFTILEEWIWIKTTANGQPISPPDGLWRKPYEILVIGQRIPIACNESQELNSRVKRRVIAAMPDLHSRKPNMKALFERVFFAPEGKVERYAALEVFARNLTAGWWACGNEVLKFNASECWVET
jgi:N6-adenosine-specific RNA methylase IME4